MTFGAREGREAAASAAAVARREAAEMTLSVPVRWRWIERFRRGWIDGARVVEGTLIVSFRRCPATVKRQMN